jgi:hypothetical protein
VEHEYVLMLHEPLRFTVGDGGTHILLLEERGAGREPAVADARDERRAFLVRMQDRAQPVRIRVNGVDELVVPVGEGRTKDFMDSTSDVRP